MAASTTAEADTLKAFIPDLVTAICDCVQSVSDQCLAKGLVSQTTHERVLESRGTSKEQARTLILSVQNSTKTDKGCFEVLLDILNEILPYRVKEKLLSEMRKDLADHSGASMRKALIPASLGTRFVVEDDRLQHVQQQGFLFGKYESSMKKYAHASAEKAVYEESLQNKTKESGRLRSNLEVLKTQSSDVNYQEIDNTIERLSACEMEMTTLKERIEKLEGVVQEEDMQARRGKSILMVGTKTFARMTGEQFAAILMEEKEEHKRLLKEREDELRQKMQEEMNTKIALMEKEQHEQKKLMKQQEDELRRKMQEKMNRRDLEHKVVLQEKELWIKELELNKTKMRQETPGYHNISSLQVPSYKTGPMSMAAAVYQQSSRSLLGQPGLRYPTFSQDTSSATWATSIPQRVHYPAQLQVQHLAPLGAHSEHFSYRQQSLNEPGRLTQSHLSGLVGQLSQYASTWRVIGYHLGFLPGELSNIEASPNLIQGAPVSWLHAMLAQWLQRTSSPTLEDLKTALGKAGLAAAAHNLKL